LAKRRLTGNNAKLITKNVNESSEKEIGVLIQGQILFKDNPGKQKIKSLQSINEVKNTEGRSKLKLMISAEDTDASEVPEPRRSSVTKDNMDGSLQIKTIQEVSNEQL